MHVGAISIAAGSQFFSSFLAKVMKFFFLAKLTLHSQPARRHTAKVPLNVRIVVQTDKLTESETERRLIGEIILLT